MINAIFFYRIGHWFYNHHLKIFASLIELIIFLIYNSRVPSQAKIGKGTALGYGGIGVVIHKKCIVGDNVMIAQQVTLGGGNQRYPGVPTVGNNVYIGKGAMVMGGITIGNNATIGANAVVNKPVPDNAIVAGVPAKILRYKE